MSKIDAMKMVEQEADANLRAALDAEIEEAYSAVKRDDVAEIALAYYTWRTTSDDDLDYFPECIIRQTAKDVVEEAKNAGYRMALGKRKLFGVPFTPEDRPKVVPDEARFITIHTGYSYNSLYIQAVYVWKERGNA